MQLDREKFTAHLIGLYLSTRNQEYLCVTIIIFLLNFAGYFFLQKDAITCLGEETAFGEADMTGEPYSELEGFNNMGNVSEGGE